MSNQPAIPLDYNCQILKAHDGSRYVYTAWNDYFGIFLVAPQYPNCQYNQPSAKREMQALAQQHNCYLEHNVQRVEKPAKK